MQIIHYISTTIKEFNHDNQHHLTDFASKHIFFTWQGTPLFLLFFDWKLLHNLLSNVIIAFFLQSGSNYFHLSAVNSIYMLSKMFAGYACCHKWKNIISNVAKAVPVLIAKQLLPSRYCHQRQSRQNWTRSGSGPPTANKGEKWVCFFLARLVWLEMKYQWSSPLTH